MPGLFDGTQLEQPVTCPFCRRSADDCTCPRDAQGNACPPANQPARVRREKRRGKWVTVVTGLDPNATDCKQLAKALKAKCATGGTATDDGIELQGDHRDAVIGHLKSLGYSAKPAGG